MSRERVEALIREGQDLVEALTSLGKDIKPAVRLIGLKRIGDLAAIGTLHVELGNLTQEEAAETYLGLLKQATEIVSL